MQTMYHHLLLEEELTPTRFVFQITSDIDLDVSAPNNVIRSYSSENYQSLFTIDSTGLITIIALFDAEVQDEFLTSQLLTMRLHLFDDFIVFLQ